VNTHRTVYLREDAVLPALDAWLAKVFAPHRVTELIDDLEAAQQPDTAPAAEQAREKIAECDRKLARHRAALEALDNSESNPSVIAAWIARTEGERAKAQAQLRQATGRVRMSETRSPARSPAWATTSTSSARPTRRTRPSCMRSST
jgi:site-specific DNA recombinase